MTDLNAIADRIVNQGVHICLSSMVSTLARAAGDGPSSNISQQNLNDLTEQAFELACPIADHESAAVEAGAKLTCRDDGRWVILDEPAGSLLWSTDYPSAEALAESYCHEYDLEPYDREVFEHWAVSTWLAEKLTAAGERVDTDFAGLCVWARTTTGQQISADAVIQRIAAEVAAA